eukprot:scaffold67827_cov71-Phaeocystis_antarctica.AAC.4
MSALSGRPVPAFSPPAASTPIASDWMRAVSAVTPPSRANTGRVGTAESSTSEAKEIASRRVGGAHAAPTDL